MYKKIFSKILILIIIFLGFFECNVYAEYPDSGDHDYKYEKYSITYHMVTCKNNDCTYEDYMVHSNLLNETITNGENILGIVYSSTESLDKYHKLVCDDCGEIIGIAEHLWIGGDTSAHTCLECGYVHSKANDSTKGRHYFDIEKISTAGNVTKCVLCGEYLKLTYESDSILSKLPKKEEYTMVGNPKPMREV